MSAATTSASAEGASRRMMTGGMMAGGMIAAATGGTATTTTCVMHQHGYRHHLDEGRATVLTDVGLLLLTRLGICGLACRLGIRQHSRVSATLRASRKLVVTATVFLHHDNVAVVAAVRRKLQGPHPILHLVDLRQAEIIVLAHHVAAFRTTAVIAAFRLLL